MSSFNDQELRSYILEEASPSLKAAIDNAIVENVDLKDHIDFLRALQLGFETQEISSSLKSINSEAEIPPSKNIKYGLILFAIAATFFILWFLGFRMEEKAPVQKDEIQYAQFLKPPNGLPTPMGDSDNNKIFLDAMVDYKSEKYNLALKKWQVLDAKHNSDTLQYYLGACHFALENYPKAIPYLENVTQNENSVFQQSAFWYQGIAESELGNKSKAFQLLQRSNHQNKDKALKFLDQ